MAKPYKVPRYRVALESTSGGDTGGFTVSRHRTASAAKEKARKHSKRYTRLNVCAIDRAALGSVSVVACYRGGRRVK